MHHKLTLIGIMTAVFASGCATGPTPIETQGAFIYFSPPTTDVAGSRRPETVEIFYKATPTKPYKPMGMIEATAWGSGVGEQDLLRELRTQAALMNASAVTQVDVQHFNYPDDRLYASGLAIEYTAAPAVSQATKQP